MKYRMFSRSDAIALFVIVPALLTMAVGVLGQGRAKEMSNRAYCAANLAGVLKSMNVYANDNNDYFPTVLSTTPNKYTAAFKPDEAGGTTDEAISAYYTAKVPQQSGDVPANLWVLVLKGYTAPKQYVCRSDPFADAKAKSEANKGMKFLNNFSSAKTFSYSFAYPWTFREGMGHSANYWKSIVDSTVPIAADMAPYLDPKGAKGEVVTKDNVVMTMPGDDAAMDPAPAMPATAPRKGMPVVDVDPATLLNSQNHGAAGITVGWSDAHVTFEKRPDVGIDNDNIWTIREKAGDKIKERAIVAGDLGAQPNQKPNEYDIVMVPVRDAKGNVK